MQRLLPCFVTSRALAPPWPQLVARLPTVAVEPPLVVDAVRHVSTPPPLPDDEVILYRERNGWCPYSERVWLALELKRVPFSTVLIDNTGGSRPSWFGGTTPRIRWADGKEQGESMDIVKALDDRYPETPPLFDDASAGLVGKFRECFPRATRPSSRAAFLFRGSGGPVARRDFEATLEKTDALLAERGGPFFAGAAPTAPDIAWAPFLERYAAQLPLLHEGLGPRDATAYPHLAQWYDAMEETIPAYACRVRGDAASWAKVLDQAGFGNSGSVPEIAPDAATEATDAAAAARGAEIWSAYASDRPWIAASPGAEAAATIARRREAIAADAEARGVADADEGLRGVVDALLDGASLDALLDGASLDDTAAGVAAYLDERLCVPRDLGAPAAAAIRRLVLN